MLLELDSGNLNVGSPCSAATIADTSPPVAEVAPNLAFDACFGVLTSEALPMLVPETLEGKLLDETGVVRCTERGVFDILLVDLGALVCWEPTALNKLEEVGFIVSTPTPSTGVGALSAEVSLLDDCPVAPNLKGCFDIWLGETEFACMFAPNVVPPKTFEVPTSSKGFDVPPMVPRTDVDG